ncbi:MAG: LacI family transcriptional regulator [Paraglaciecola sp.]|nr:LacI family transcriptional regulator [Paraglaciecola sp.]
MTNIRTVADLAKVSVATVSRTLKQPQLVSVKTREKVVAAVKQAGYRPNLMAVKFRSGKTNNLVVLVPTIANVFFARVFSGMQKVADERQYSLLLCNTQGNIEIETHYARMVQTSQADGLIQLSASNPFEQLNHGVTDKLPMVNACEVMDKTTCPTVMLDNRAAAFDMTEYLISLGHQHIAMLKGPLRSPLTRDRVAGYQDALRQAQIPMREEYLLLGDFTLQAGYDAASEVMQLATRPSAIFCENDEMAIGLMKGLKEHGLRIPEDISIAGFDDIAFAQYSDPPLTTIAQPAEEFGRIAVTLLIELLEGRLTKAPKVILPYELISRASTGPAKPLN